MTAIHILLQAGNVTISSAVNQIVEQVGVPVFDAILFVGGIAFITPFIIMLAYTIEYLIHPTSFGRSTALSEAITHAKRPILGALFIFLGIYIGLFIMGLASGNTTLTQNAGTYALEILEAMLRETASVFSLLIKHALSTTP
jgi:hypothetical protein